jgi:Mg2+-importing ATPase
MALPFTPAAAWLGFVAPPPVFFLYLAAAVGGYLALVEAAKRVFYTRVTAAPADSLDADQRR